MPAPRRHSSSRRGAPSQQTPEEIILRCGGRPATLGVEDGPVVSVAAIMRREGRGPHAAPGPLRRRTHLRPIGVLPVPPAPPRRSVRKVTVAATAFFAIGAIVGPSILSDAALPRAEAKWPGPDATQIGSGGGSAFRGDRSATPPATWILPAELTAVHVDSGGADGPGARRATPVDPLPPGNALPGAVSGPRAPGPGNQGRGKPTHSDNPGHGKSGARGKSGANNPGRGKSGTTNPGNGNGNGNQGKSGTTNPDSSEPGHGSSGHRDPDRGKPGRGNPGHGKADRDGSGSSGGDSSDRASSSGGDAAGGRRGGATRGGDRS